MRKSLIALATASILVSGAAAAESFTFRVDSQRVPGFVVVQNDDAEWRRWYDDGRRFSIDERQAQIHARIQRGTELGQLTRREARQLERQLARTENKERGYEYDGRLNRNERADLHSDLDQLAQRLRFERRDAQNRY
jgi:hypothetical protein